VNRIIHPRDLAAHPDAVYIGREHAGRGRGPSFKRSPWANPWNWRKVGRARAVELFAAWVAGDANAAALLPPGRWPRPTVESIRQELAGRTLACWCPCGEPCHGRVLAEIACGPESPARAAGPAPTSVILTGDCLEHLAAMEPGTVDLVVADPPYNIGIDYGNGSKADRLTDAAYGAWVQQWIAAAARAIAPHGTLWIVCGQEYAGDHQLAIRAAGLHWRNTVTWRETFGVNCRRKFNRTSRPMFYAVKDPRRFTFNAEHLTVRSRRQEIGDRRANPAGKILDDVWTIPRVCGTFRERVDGVPTQIPLALVRRVVLGMSNPGDLVVDPFTGSGTTGVVCADSGRRFVGIELREQFAAIARSRISTTASEGLAVSRMVGLKP
jgi:site-specific DNA-methyltransferase (adenine-specific)